MSNLINLTLRLGLATPLHLGQTPPPPPPPPAIVVPAPAQAPAPVVSHAAVVAPPAPVAAPVQPAPVPGVPTVVLSTTSYLTTYQNVQTDPTTGVSVLVPPIVAALPNLAECQSYTASLPAGTTIFSSCVPQTNTTLTSPQQ